MSWPLIFRGRTASHGEPVNHVVGHRLNGVKDLALFIPDKLGLETDRRFHGHHGNQLEEVVLDNVPDNPGLLVEGAPALDPEVFSDRDLDMIDMTAVPEIFKDTVRKTEEDNILNRLFAEIVIEPIDLVSSNASVSTLFSSQPRGGPCRTVSQR